MPNEHLILTEREAAAAVNAIRATDLQEASRLEMHMKGGARLVFFTGGGTIAIYAADNHVPARGPGLLQSNEHHRSVDDLAAAYALEATA